MNPLCVLDFYVYDKCQRSGYGKIIYTEMLNKENIEPRKLAIDRPSSKFLSFMKKYYNLANFVPQNNNYVVFKDYFRNDIKNINNTVNKYYPYDHSKIALSNKLYTDNVYNNNYNNNYAYSQSYNKQIDNQLNNINNNIDSNIATYENNYKIFQNYSKLANRPLSHNNEINSNYNNNNIPLQQQNNNNNNIYNTPYSKTNYLPENLDNYINNDEPYEFIDTYKNSYEQKPYYHDFYKEQYKENYYNTQKYKQRDYFKYSAPSNNKYLYQPSSSAYGAYYNMNK
jgi:hypothetical protein